jgi:hypothetical protein
VFRRGDAETQSKNTERMRESGGSRSPGSSAEESETRAVIEGFA